MQPTENCTVFYVQFIRLVKQKADRQTNVHVTFLYQLQINGLVFDIWCYGRDWLKRVAAICSDMSDVPCQRNVIWWA